MDIKRRLHEIGDELNEIDEQLYNIGLKIQEREDLKEALLDQYDDVIVTLSEVAAYAAYLQYMLL